MRRFYFVLLTALIALITACQPISGKLTVARKLALELTEQDHPSPGVCVARHDDCGDPVVKRVSASFHPGTYDARLDIDDTDAIQLTVDDGTDRNAVFRVAIPEDVHLPKTSGRFVLPADESGQPFDLNGMVRTVESSSPVTAGWERCHLSVKRRVCAHTEYKGKKTRRNPRCRYVYDSIYGQRPVEFHRVLKTRMVTLDFNAGVTGESVARFSGSSARSYKVYDYRGYCDIDNIFVRRGLW